MTGVILPKQPVSYDEAYMLIRKNLQMLSDAIDTGSGDTGSGIHKAFANAAAEASTTIECHLDTDITGDLITVNCSVIGGDGTGKLNGALPRLAVGSLIFVALIGTDWWCVGPFSKTRVC